TPTTILSPCLPTSACLLPSGDPRRLVPPPSQVLTLSAAPPCARHPVLPRLEQFGQRRAHDRPRVWLRLGPRPQMLHERKSAHRGKHDEQATLPAGLPSQLADRLDHARRNRTREAPLRAGEALVELGVVSRSDPELHPDREQRAREDLPQTVGKRRK